MKFPNPTKVCLSVKNSRFFLPNPNRNHIRAHFWARGAYFLAIVVLSALVTGAVVSASSSSAFIRLLSGSLSGLSSSSPSKVAAETLKGNKGVSEKSALPTFIKPLFLQQAPQPESIQIYASDCSSAAPASFSVGNTVCAKAGGFSVYSRKIYWVNPDGIVVQADDVSAASPSSSRTISARGVWHAYLVDGADGSLRISTPFSVSDAQNPSVDLSVVAVAVDSNVAAAGDIIYRVIVRNAGPDTASNLQLTESAPNNTTFVSKTVPTGASCSSDTDCSISSLAAGASKTFTFTYNVNSGTPVGTEISNAANVTSDTEELHAADNLWKETVDVVSASQTTSGGGGGGGGTCTLACPDDVSQTANTTGIVNGQTVPGAIVHFSAPVGSDECGTITLDHPNDSFFPVGNTVVTATATATGDSCSFNVTVMDNSNAPSISCPENKTANAGADCQVTVDVGTATYTGGQNVTLTAVRSDGLPLSDPYPAGTTTIKWTATSHSDNPPTEDNATGSDTCTQTVIVSDVTAPTIVAPPQTASADASCQAAVPDFTTTATITDNCADRSAITVTQDPAPGTIVGLGPHTITLTATDEANNTKTEPTTFTVNDTTPPVVSCPADITVYLPLNTPDTSMIVNYPAATATDNCGTPTIGYSKASGTVFNIGTTPVTVTADDGRGNTASCTFNVTVLYDFTGFFAPVINPPTFNVVKAGSAVPVKFSLSGNKGLNIFAANSPQSGVIPCDASAPATDLTDTVNAGGSSLSYDATSDQYNYVWKTNSTWAGQCRQLVVTLNDGTQHVANFKFK